MKKWKFWLGIIIVVLLIGQSFSYATSSGKIKLGSDVLLSDYTHLIDGKRVGVITNQTGVNSQGKHITDQLASYPNTTLSAIFAPEHGLDGLAKAGKYVESYTHPKWAIPVFSLYGKTRMPTEDMLKNVDVLIYDIQDIGARTYTYISTLNYSMIAAQKYGKPVIVLDRPNPLGGEIVDGPVLEEGYQTFVGVDRLPMAHGMTMGELAQFFNRKIGADLSIVQMEDYKRNMLFEDTGLTWVPSSPNIPNLQSLRGYMATGLGEGTGIIQRDKFHWIGGKGVHSTEYAKRLNEVNLPGVQFVGEQQGAYGGVRLNITNRQLFNPARTGIYALSIANQMGSFTIPKSGKQMVMFDKIMGTNKIGDALRKKTPPQQIEQLYQADLEQFKIERKKHLIYEQQLVGEGDSSKEESPDSNVKGITLSTGLVVEGEVYVPARALTESLGHKIGWDEATKTVVISIGEEEISLQPGVDPAESNSFIKDGITYIPEDMIAKFGPEVQVQKDGNRMQVKAPSILLTMPLTAYIPPAPPQPTGKIAYLTFDDGPSGRTSEVLDVLRDHGVQATFFLVGKSVAGHEAVVKRMHDDGHTIGGHSFSHEYGHIYKSPLHFFTDLNRGFEAIANVTGEKPTIFRFPGGSNNGASKNAQDPEQYAPGHWIMEDLVKQSKEKGLRYYDWNVTNGDATGNHYTVEGAVQQVKNSLNGQQQVVVLQHDSEPKHNTVKALPGIIQYLKNEGYTLKALDKNITGFTFLR